MAALEIVVLSERVQIPLATPLVFIKILSDLKIKPRGWCEDKKWK